MTFLLYLVGEPTLQLGFDLLPTQEIQECYGEIKDTSVSSYIIMSLINRPAIVIGC